MDPIFGTLALDIDGTLTVTRHSLPPNVKAILESYVRQGWQLLFVTGRTYSFAHTVVGALDVPYALAVQNGAALYQMPSGEQLIKHYLPARLLAPLEALFSSEPGGLLIESGKEKGDRCYFNPDAFTPEERAYLDIRMEINPEAWIPTSSLASLPIEEFAIGKHFTTETQAPLLASRIHDTIDPSLNIFPLRDPFRPGYHLIQIGAPHASKGEILKEWPHPGPIIAAGDDFNDIPLLEQADIKIVMADAPEPLHPLADIVAPPADQEGIIPALTEAMRRL